MLIDPPGAPECLVIATGSEIGIAAQAVNALNGLRTARAAGVHALAPRPLTPRMGPTATACCRRQLTRRLAVEAGATQCWWRYVGTHGRVLGIDRFGASGKAADVFPHFGFTADNIAQQIRELLED